MAIIFVCEPPNGFFHSGLLSRVLNQNPWAVAKTV